MNINGVPFISKNNEGWTTVTRKRKYKHESKSETEDISHRPHANPIKKSRRSRKLKPIIEVSSIYEKLNYEAVDEYIPMIEKALLEIFRDGYNKHYADSENSNNTDENIIEGINYILSELGIKISGGFILKSLGLIDDSSSIDIDIYVPYNSTSKDYKIFSNLFNSNKYILYKISPNGKKGSFFRMNGIETVRKYKKSDPVAEMDIVRPIYSRNPINIIKAFDLSFCQNWYDGRHLYMMHKDAVFKREPGYLMPFYNELYLTEKNPTTLGRIAKYMKRGFRIAYEDSKSKEIIEILESPI